MLVYQSVTLTFQVFLGIHPKDCKIYWRLTTTNFYQPKEHIRFKVVKSDENWYMLLTFSLRISFWFCSVWFLHLLWDLSVVNFDHESSCFFFFELTLPVLAMNIISAIRFEMKDTCPPPFAYSSILLEIMNHEQTANKKTNKQTNKQHHNIHGFLINHLAMGVAV